MIVLGKKGTILDLGGGGDINVYMMNLNYIYFLLFLTIYNGERFSAYCVYT